MIMTVTLFMCTVLLLTLLMTRALDSQALDEAAAQGRNVEQTLLSKARMMTLDYSKWDAAVAAMREADEAWVYDNIGSTARIGRDIQLAIVWGGAMSADHGWTDQSERPAQTGILASDTLRMITGRLALAPMGEADGVEFFEWYEGSLFVVGAARFEPVEDGALWGEQAGAHGQLLMGRRLAEEELAEIAESQSLVNLRVLAAAPEDLPSRPLVGLNGEAVAFLAWDVPQPSRDMLAFMAPWLAIVTALTTCLVGLSMRLLRRNAEHLVAAEHRASASIRLDALTGLPNRVAFREALDRKAKAGRRAVLFLDINGFKSINDTMGHSAGDSVIVGMARRLDAFSRPNRLVARISGDEFVLMVTADDAGREIDAVARDIEAALATPMTVQGCCVHVRAAIGYAVQARDDISGEDLVRQADLAMYEAKRRHDQQPVAFSSHLEGASQHASRIERGLHDCLANGEGLSVRYQPIVTSDGRLHRAEALARWRTPQLGSVPPQEFIDVAERSGLIHELGRRLLDIVCDDLAAHPSLRVSLNVSPVQLNAPGFLSELMRRLSARSVDPRRIELEVTESVLISDLEKTRRHLAELRSAGFSVALDDFGTGYSSVAYLEQLEFDTLKIDRSFVAETRSSRKRLALLRAMIDLAHGQGLRVVCEGVETSDDLRMLRELGCDLMQGFHFARPMRIADLASAWCPSAFIPEAA